METNKKNIRFLSQNALKFIAFFTMIVGHFLIYTVQEFRFFGLRGPLLNVLLYAQFIAPPIFFFFIAEGFAHTKSAGKYTLRMLIFTLITQVAYVFCHYLEFDWKIFLTQWNVMATLFLGLMALRILDLKIARIWKILIILTICVLAYYTEWGFVGVIVILLFYLLRNKSVLRFVSVWLLLLAYLVFLSDFTFRFSGIFNHLIAFTVSILLIAFFYNGKRGTFLPKFMQVFYYIAYPAHLAIICWVRVLSQAK